MIVLAPRHMVIFTSLPSLETVMPLRLALATKTGEEARALLGNVLL